MGYFYKYTCSDRSIDRSLRFTERMPWIILRLWGFFCVRDAGHRGNKITGLRSLFWSSSDRCVFAFLFQGGWDAGYLYECEFDEGKKPAPAEGQEDTRDEPIRSIPVDGSDDKPIRSVCFRWVDEKSLALRQEWFCNFFDFIALCSLVVGIITRQFYQTII